MSLLTWFKHMSCVRRRIQTCSRFDLLFKKKFDRFDRFNFCILATFALFNGQGCLKESLPADYMRTLNELFLRRSSTTAFINVTGESHGPKTSRPFCCVHVAGSLLSYHLSYQSQKEWLKKDVSTLTKHLLHIDNASCRK